MVALKCRLGLLPACVLVATVALATPGRGQPNSTSHYVYATQHFGSLAWGAGAVFPVEMPYVPTYREPGKSCDYASITQMALGHGDIGVIEYGWVVDPVAYNGDARPHLLLVLRGSGVGPGGRNIACFAEKSGGCRETAELLRCLGSNNPDPQSFPDAFVPVAGAEVYPGDALTPSEPVLLYIAYYPPNHAWWVQYKDRWIGYIPDGGNYFPQPLVGAVEVDWFGEVNTPTGKGCVGMGNDYLGTDSRSARITNMLYLDSKTGRIESAEAYLSDKGDKPVPGSEEGYLGGFYTLKGMPSNDVSPFDAFNYGGLGWNCIITR